MKRGFTLVELLAVIIILAVIVAIVIPIVADLLDDSKEKSNIVSIEMYGRALAQASLEYELNENKRATNYEEVKKYLKYNGDTVECSIMNIDGNNVFLDECTVDGVKVNNYSYGVPGLCMLMSGNANEIGAKYLCEVKPDTSYNFYVLSHEADGSANLIMERNICEDGTVATESKTCLTQWYDGGHSSYGPVDAMEFLHAATDDWINIPNIQLNYSDEGNTGSSGYGSIITIENETKITDSYSNNITASFINLKARLPYLREMSEASTVTNSYLFDYLTLYNNIQLHPINGIRGYWLLSSQEFSNLGLLVYNSGYIGESEQQNSIPDPQGVRPVINIKL